MKSFKTGNMRQTSGSILWSTIQSLDVAMKFKGAGFINLSIVSSELVKFLLINTGYESIKSLEEKVAGLEAVKADNEKALKAVVSSTTTSSKKLDTLSKLFAALKKRIKKLE